ncbi:hypothetical protein DSECCO2_629640 [anaerobic digester metagenome]
MVAFNGCRLDIRQFVEGHCYLQLVVALPGSLGICEKVQEVFQTVKFTLQFIKQLIAKGFSQILVLNVQDNTFLHILQTAVGKRSNPLAYIPRVGISSRKEGKRKGRNKHDAYKKACKALVHDVSSINLFNAKLFVWLH